MQSHQEIQSFPHWFEGSHATHQVARSIVQYGPIARTALAPILGLSQGALSRITSDLIYAGVIEELPAGEETQSKLPSHITYKETTERRGRPQTALRICSNTHTFLGVNIHDQAISVCHVNTLCEPLSEVITEPLDSTDPKAIAQQIARLIQPLHSPTVTALGVGFGGHILSNRYVTYAPFLHWHDTVDLGALIQEATGLPTTISNDLDSILLYESWFGDAVGIDRFALLTIGAGIGYALAEHGDAVHYPDKSYGLAGHILIDPEGPRCSAGHIGCSQCLTSDSIAEEYSAIIGHAATFEDFTADVYANKAQARRLAERTGFRLGVLISMIANLAMPPHVIVSGESSFLAQMTMESIRKGIETYRHTQASSVDFHIPDFGWHIWANAAAACAIAQYIGA